MQKHTSILCHVRPDEHSQDRSFGGALSLALPSLFSESSSNSPQCTSSGLVYRASAHVQIVFTRQWKRLLDKWARDARGGWLHSSYALFLRCLSLSLSPPVVIFPPILSPDPDLAHAKSREDGNLSAGGGCLWGLTLKAFTWLELKAKKK